MGMDLDRLAAVEPAVDERAVEEELALYLSPPPPPTRGASAAPAREPWKITSVAAADWAMRMLGDCKARVQEYDDQITLWQRARRQIATAGDWFEERLKEWGIGERTPQRKSFPLAHGTIQTRETQPRAVVVNEDQAIAWAKVVVPDAVKVEESFLISRAGVTVEPLVVAFASTQKATGDVETIPVDRLKMQPAPLDQLMFANLQERLGDGFVVEAVTELFAVHHTTMTVGEGEHAEEVDSVVIVPGLDVQDGAVTATVRPLGV